jgi:anti-anti-sigma factor
MRESPAVQQFALKALEDEGVQVAVDLTACEYLDSTFLGCLVILYKRFGTGAEPRLQITASTEVCHRLLHASHLDALLHTTEACPEVIGEDLDIPTLTLGARDLGRHVMECHRRLAEIGGPQHEAFEEIADQLRKELVEHD